MSLINFFDFEYVTDAYITQEGFYTTGGFNGITSPGRFDNNCYRGVTGQHGYVMPINVTHGFNGYAVYLFNPVTSTQIHHQIFDGTTTQLEIRWTAANHLQVTRNGTVLATSSGTFATGIWHYFDYEVVIDPTVGVFKLWRDGVSVFNLTGINTQNSSNAYYNKIQWDTAASTFRLDDVYFLDNQGSTNNSRIGECKSVGILINGNGLTDNLVPLSGSNYQNVNEVVPDGDTSYNSSATPGDLDLYTIPAQSIPGTIFGTKTSVVYRKDDANARTCAILIRSGSTTFVGSTLVCSSSYQIGTQIDEVDPNTSSAWTNSNLNAAQIGFKIIS